jgi:hemerythrin-like domain-containing protein
MNATEILTSEHGLIEQVLCALETGAWFLAQDEPLRPDFFIETTDFIIGFVDGYHHQKEEGILFKYLLENGMTQENSPVAVMLHEHEMARAYTQALRLAATRLKAGDMTARLEVIYNARHYVNLLRNHIGMEDQIFFPLADRLIPEEQQAVIGQSFEQHERQEMDEGVQQKYLALARALEAEIFGLDDKPDHRTPALSDLLRPALIFDNE